MTDSPEEIESRLGASRRALEHDAHALKAKASPRNLLHTATRRASSKSQELGSRTLRSARSHPGPMLVIAGALGGAAWLAMRGRRASRRDLKTVTE